MRLVQKSGKQSDREEIKRLYNKYFSKNYDKHMEETNHYATMQKIIIRLRSHFNGRILDPSCGTGEALKMMLELFGADARLLIGNDFSERMLEQARIKLRNSGSLLTTFDAEEGIKLASSTIGTVFCSYTFHWFVDKKAVAEEFRRVLVPEGTLISVEEFPVIVNNSRYMPPTIKKSIIHRLKKTKLSGLDRLIHELRDAGLIFVDLVIEKIDDNHDMYGLVFKRA